MTVQHGGDLFAVSARHGWDWRTVLDFSASINPLGPAPGVLPAIQAALERIVHYPARQADELRCLLAQHWNLRPAQLLLGNGATDLLHFFARIYRTGRVTLLTPTFSEFHRAYPNAHLASWNRVDEWPTEGLLVLTQPNNPLGQAIPWETLKARLLATQQPVLIDESFLDFTMLPSALTLLEQRPNLFVLRSLTKFHALPGLRVGALAASRADIAILEPQREPWQVNVLAAAAAACAVVDDDHARATRLAVATERDWLFQELSAQPGALPYAAVANYLFVTLEYPSAPLVKHLLQQRILIRDCTGWPGVNGEAVRVAVRNRAEQEQLIAAWKEFSCAG